MKKEKSGTVYVLSIDLNKQKYYVMDLEGSLSRSISDSMLFLYESIAESYAGPIEHLIEEKTGEIATIRVIKLPLSRVIPGTWQDDVEEKATKLALDDLSCESIEQLANHLHKALESTLKSNS